MPIKRCGWSTRDKVYERYHDHEWGVPVHDDRKFFEMLTLEGAQAGLSWITVLRKRENYRKSFHNFDPKAVAKMGSKHVAHLLKNEGLIRNRLKIESTISNARAFLEVQKEFGSFDKFIWRFVDGEPKVNHVKTLKDVPSKTSQSDAMSRDLKKRGFRFVGSTICYAFMQACGLVNDHILDCFKSPHR